MLSHEQPPQNAIRGALRFTGLVLFMFSFPVAAILVLGAGIFGERSRYRMIMALTTPWCGTIAALMGVRVKVHGRRSDKAQLFVGNHVTYLDILTAGAVIGGVFVSRHDIKNWPGIGLFARLAGTVFIDRASIFSAMESSEGIVARARQGARITLFPEGGTTPGEGVGPFKPFLFGAIGGSQVWVQPFTILYTRVDGRPLTHDTRDLVYWYRPNEPFLAHGWKVLKLPGITAEITFHDPIPPPVSTDKNVLREYAEVARQSVAQGVGPLPRE